jgi:small subunit ribosomal protein S20
LANIASARKRARQSEVNRTRNASARSMLRTYIRKVVLAIEKGDKEGARTALIAAVPVIDRMAGRGIIHRNKAARHKSRLNARILALGQPG